MCSATAPPVVFCGLNPSAFGARRMLLGIAS